MLESVLLSVPKPTSAGFGLPPDPLAVRPLSASFLSRTRTLLVTLDPVKGHAQCFRG